MYFFLVSIIDFCLTTLPLSLHIDGIVKALAILRCSCHRSFRAAGPNVALSFRIEGTRMTLQGFMIPCQFRSNWQRNLKRQNSCPSKRHSLVQWHVHGIFGTASASSHEWEVLQSLIIKGWTFSAIWASRNFHATIFSRAVNRISKKIKFDPTIAIITWSAYNIISSHILKMSKVFNKIFDKVLLRTITIRGKNVKLFAATKTEMWTRPSNIAQNLDSRFAAAVKNNEDRVPEGTVEICLR